MTTLETRYCLCCLKEFNPGTLDEILCPDCTLLLSPSPQRNKPAPNHTLIELNRYSRSKTFIEPPQPVPQPYPEGKGGNSLPLQGRVGVRESVRESKSFLSILDIPSEWEDGDRLLDTYQVTGLLGEGGMGKVYQVVHLHWNIPLAVKSPHQHLFQTSKQKDLFIEEADTWINLGLHPHITSCYYVRNLGGIPRLFAELVEGGSLASWIENRRIQTVAQAIDIGIQFAWGLAYAHEQKLIHRDVKPTNVLMTMEGIPKVTDFGLAHSKKGFSPFYTSPEQAEAQYNTTINLTPASDLWGWALSLLEMFAGSPFWANPAMPEFAWGQMGDLALAQYLDGKVDNCILPMMPISLSNLLRQCFKKVPSSRPGSMIQVAQQLIQIFQSETGQLYPRKMPSKAELRADSLNNKALSLMDLDRAKEAKSIWEQALKFDAHHAESVYNLGLFNWRQAEQTDFDLVRQMDAVSANQPDSWRPHYLLGQVHLERGDGDSARKCFEIARQIAPKVKEISTMVPYILQANAVKIRGLENHAKNLRSFHPSPDGKLLLVLDDDNIILLIDLDNNRLLQTISDQPERIDDLVFTPDSHYILSGGEDAVLRIYDTANGKLLKKIPAHKGGWIYHILPTQDGKRAITGGAGKNHNLQVIDLEHGRTIHNLKGHHQPLHDMAISKDGHYAITGTSSGSKEGDFEIRLWDTWRGECLRNNNGGTTPVAITPDGRIALSQGTYLATLEPLGFQLIQGDGTLCFWDVSSGQLLHRKENHKSEIKSISISNDGEKALTASQDRTICLWDIKAGICEQTMKGHENFHLNSAKFLSKDLAISASSGDSTVRIWRLSDGRCLRTYPGFKHGSVIKQDQNKILLIDESDHLEVWSMEGIGAIQASWSVSRPTEAVQALKEASIGHSATEEARHAIRNEHPQLALQALRRAMDVPGFERDPDLLDLWHEAGTQAGKPSGLLSAKAKYKIKSYSNLNWTICPIILINNGKTIVAPSSQSETLAIYDLVSGGKLGELKGHEQGWGVVGFGMANDNKTAFTAGDFTARLWDFSHYNQKSILYRHDKPFSVACVSPDGHYGFAGAWDGLIMVWELPSGKLLSRLVKHRSIIRELLFPSNGQQIISISNDGVMEAWTIPSFDHCRSMSMGEAGIWTACLTPDGKRILAGDGDGQVSVWNVETGRCQSILEGHTGRIEDICSTLDGKTCISGDENGIICVWSLDDKSCKYKLLAPGKIKTLALSVDGRFLFSGGKDWNVSVWDIVSGRLERVLTGHETEVNAIFPAPNQRNLLTGSNCLIVWQLDWDYELKGGT